MTEILAGGGDRWRFGLEAEIDAFGLEAENPPEIEEIRCGDRQKI